MRKYNVPWLFIFIGCNFFVACKKADMKNIYQRTISGRILESNSSRIPIRNYKLMLYQEDDYGWLGGTSGITEYFQTDENGNFSHTYTLATPSNGLFQSGINTYPISIRSIDTTIYKGLYFRRYPIPSNKDTSLNLMFLFKKIDMFVRKIQFDSALNANDSLEVITHSAFNPFYKTVYGPMPSGSLLIVDTINGFKIENYNMSSGSYFTSSTLKKPFYNKYFNLILPAGDDSYREQILAYP